MGETKQVLVADDEENLRRILKAQLQHDGYEVHCVSNGEAVLKAMAEHHIDVLITDLRMPKLDGMQVLKAVGERFPNVPVIMITAHGTVDTAVEALKLGAFDYVTKPFDRAEFRAVVAKAARTRELSQKHVSGDPNERGRYRIIGESEPMRDVYDVIEKVADTPSTVLITGESGTGKELIARALHENSSRKNKPFVSVNCAAIPPDLLESELFGYERGAFTGAVTSKPGRFELAHGGTLFLDEIAEIPVSMQVKLLRALQEQQFERVGGIKTITVDSRLITATNRNLKESIAEGGFREDLYYRLNVVHVHLPPLRARPTDIPLLLEHFVSKFNDKLDRSVTGFDDQSKEHLLGYAWPGNIRELENIVERCMIFAEDGEVGTQHLPPEIREAEGPIGAGLVSGTAATPGTTGLKEAVREATLRLEREFIGRALNQTGGNVTHTARLLKISRKSLQNKMKELGLRND
ncbi:MAG: sigma-54 dependent transcriptional regulator [Deltaproteobacteria bacterium]|nr:sigma-54 dependent transcriptional regulator [Deltaproteobacteria bacterium]NND28793.1 sigma-54-dependent Fis family transcriptional regulator [Myxococcales bacterium]MBT8466756.1 sigma-54 dependent transcriptional regulator [Deltaproteobacteria bacterium]MBT8483767.1 sigma-54 dependent transcriptional regulator [Deltaproteobacteria bacterium]NNK07349.1 sigma-54-dependent Fis family transcriptional regulator [Myxococcales bacterium]